MVQKDPSAKSCQSARADQCRARQMTRFKISHVLERAIDFWDERAQDIAGSTEKHTQRSLCVFFLNF